MAIIPTDLRLKEKIMAEPIPKYTAVMRTLEKNNVELYNQIIQDPKLNVQILQACIVASAITNGLDE